MGNKNQTASSKSVRNQYHHHHHHQYGGQSNPAHNYHNNKNHYDTMTMSQTGQYQHHQHHQHQKENTFSKKNSIKRHLSSSSRNLVNRSSSSPMIANKWRLSQMDAQQTGNEPPESHLIEEICTLTRSPLTSRANKLARGQQQQQQQIASVQSTTQLSALTKTTANSSNSIVDLNRDLKSRQENLTNVIKRIDSTHQTTTSSTTGGSKLYRPNSFMTNQQQQQQQQNGSGGGNLVTSSDGIGPVAHALTKQATAKMAATNRNSTGGHYNENTNATNKCSTLPMSHTTHDLTAYASPLAPAPQSHHHQHHHDGHASLSQSFNKNLSKSKPNLSNGKMNNNNNSNNKRFGLSPRFKRKIVETITNRNSIFAQSRLLQALQSQWNLFASPSQRIGQKGSNQQQQQQQFEYYDDDDDNDGEEGGNRGRRPQRENTTEDDEDEENPFETNRRNQTTNGSSSTFLSTSLMRNSFRYASRRKYKTQSLANPYRHAQTNYPVYIHEALFMPEFSVKGQVTEADFEILDVISRGAFGHVIKVKKKEPQEGDHDDDHDDRQQQQIYAMKIMWKSQVIRDRALQQVKDEVTIATSCVENPLIVKTWFYWQSKRFLYIITDYVENGELLSLWLKVHHFPERLVAVYAIEMCLVLDYLHRQGIIYRDIKMENILLDKRGHVQLIDFGLSKWLPLGERTCTICGTIQYMAPEILSVEPYDHSVDWWSLGILVYALLSGEYPLSAAKDHIQMNEKVSRHVFELTQTQGKYSNESCDLVRKLLRKNPLRRMKSLAECKQDGFFHKELQTFMRLHGDTPEQELFIMDNYWNPYFIIQNYSPLQLLFDEIYASRVVPAPNSTTTAVATTAGGIGKSSGHHNKNNNNNNNPKSNGGQMSNHHKKTTATTSKHHQKVTTVVVNDPIVSSPKQSAPSPPPPPPPPPTSSQQIKATTLKSSKSSNHRHHHHHQHDHQSSSKGSSSNSSSASAASSSSCSATRTTTSIPNSSSTTASTSDDVVDSVSAYEEEILNHHQAVDSSPASSTTTPSPTAATTIPTTTTTTTTTSALQQLPASVSKRSANPTLSLERRRRQQRPPSHNRRQRHTTSNGFDEDDASVGDDADEDDDDDPPYCDEYDDDDEIGVQRVVVVHDEANDDLTGFTKF